MPGRVFERIKRRMPCTVHSEGQTDSGLVLDVSPGGLYVQTSAKALPGDRIDLEISVPGEAQQLRLQVEVRRKIVVPARLRALAHGGIGVRILNAPEAYYALMENIGSGADSGEFKGKSSRTMRKGRAPGKAAKPKDAAGAAKQATPAPPPAPEPDPKPDPEPRHKFRVRIKQSQGPRSRIVKLAADSEEEAIDLVLAEAGAGWEVLQIDYL